MTSPFLDRVMTLFKAVHPLDRVARAGYILRGVTEPESVAAHSHFLSLLTLLYVDEYPDLFNARRALTLAIVHDLSEARLMDIPMPYADAYLSEAKRKAEDAIFADLFEGFPDHYLELHREFEAAESPEARLIRGLDKAQMMLKICFYQEEGRGRLEEFWNNPKNFNDFGLEPVSDLFDAISAYAGKARPR